MAFRQLGQPNQKNHKQPITFLEFYFDKVLGFPQLI